MKLLDFKFTPEQEMTRKMAKEFAEKEIEPIAAEIDEKEVFPEKVIKKMGELGLMGVFIPEEYGGAGLDTVSYALAEEEISKASASVGVIMSVNNSLVCDPLYKFGNNEQRSKYLKPLASGQKLGAFALTEPNYGSDAAGIECKAVKEGDFYILNGNKQFITNGKEAKIFIVFARTGTKEQRHRGISAFIVEKGFKGFKVGKEEKKLGIRGSSTTELIFNNCTVPKENLLGTENEGFKIAMFTLDGGRIGIGAQALGIAQAAFEASVKYSKERVQFQKPISNFQAIQWMLADMATEIEAARLLILKAAYLKDKGEKEEYIKLSSMAKLYASEVAMKTTIKAIQIHGGYGYTKDYPVERYFRDAKITEIYEGTNEIQRIVIARRVLKNF